MSYWHLLIISATAIVLVVALYVALRWGKAPRVFKAMASWQRRALRLACS
jgi:hypothetical protein